MRNKKTTLHQMRRDALETNEAAKGSYLGAL